MGIIQNLYSSADSIILGQFAGKAAFSAVGATGSIVSFLVNIVIGINAGVSIIVARAFGANDEKRTQDAVSTAYMTSIFLGFFLLIVGELFSLPLLRFMDCPEDVIDGAHLYLSIYFLGAPASSFYSFLVPVLNARGDSTRPLIFSTVSGFLNVILNLIFVIAFSMDVAGVAIATVVSQYVSAILLFIVLVRTKDASRLRPFRFKINFSIFALMIKYGVPSVVSTTTFSFSNLQIQSAVNFFGQDGISGNSAGGQIDSYIFTFVGALGTATVTAIAQNLGAGNKDRLLKIHKTMLLFSFISTLAISGLTLLFSKQLLSIFLPDEPDAAYFGVLRLVCILSTIAIYSLSTVSWSTFRAFGKNVLQMVVNILGICGTRLIWIVVIFRLYPNPWNVYISFPVSYIIVTVIAVFVVSRHLKKFEQGKLSFDE